MLLFLEFLFKFRREFIFCYSSEENLFFLFYILFYLRMKIYLRYCNGPNRFDKLRILILKIISTKYFKYRSFATEMLVSCKFYCCFVHKSGTTLLK
jgi:hypothetical protein